MKRTIVSTSILLLGAAAAFAVAHFTGRMYLAIVVSTIAVVWAYMWHLQEIKITSWHYRVAHKYFDMELKSVCRACPYWGIVIASMIFFATEYGAKIIWGTVLQAFFYPYAAIAWLFGFWPVYRRLAYTAAYGKRNDRKNYHHFLHKEGGNGELTRSRVWPILTIGLLAAIVVPMHLGTSEISGFYASTPWYFDALASYGAIIAMVIVGDVWRKTGWRGLTLAVKWSYRKSCPSIKFVQPAAEPAKPRMPTHALPPEGANG